MAVLRRIWAGRAFERNSSSSCSCSGSQGDLWRQMCRGAFFRQTSAPCRASRGRPTPYARQMPPSTVRALVLMPRAPRPVPFSSIKYIKATLMTKRSPAPAPRPHAAAAHQAQGVRLSYQTRRGPKICRHRMSSGRLRSLSSPPAAVPNQVDPSQQGQSCDDGCIGHVEHRPWSHIGEIDHVAQQHPVQKVSNRTSHLQPQAESEQSGGLALAVVDHDQDGDADQRRDYQGNVLILKQAERTAGVIGVGYTEESILGDGIPQGQELPH